MDLKFAINVKSLLPAMFIGLLASVPLWLWGVPKGADLAHHIRLANGYYTSMTYGGFYPSWISPPNDGFGDPSSRFYPPGLYVMLSAIQLVVNDWLRAFQIVLTLLNIIGAVGIFVWARGLTNDKRAPLIAVVALVFAVFHVTTLYGASLYGQFAATCFLPFLFYFVDKIFAEGGLRNVAGCGLALALIVCFHIPVALYTAIILAIYVGWLWVQDRRIKHLINLVGSALIGTALSSLFWLRMLIELAWKKPSGIEQGAHFDYRANFLFRESGNPKMDLFVLIIAGVTFAAVLPCLILIFKKDRKGILLMAVCLFAFFMATPLSEPLWALSKTLQETQFPWRWLSMASVFTAAMFALSYRYIAELWKSKWRPVALILIGLMACPLLFTPFRIMRFADYIGPAVFREFAAQVKTMPTNADFLPIWTDGKLKPMSQPVEATRPVEVVRWSESERIFRTAEGPAETARVKLLYYPRWQATTENGEILATSPSDDGALTIVLPPRATTVAVKFHEPLAVTVTRYVGLLGFPLVILVLLIKRRNSDSEEEPPTSPSSNPEDHIGKNQ